jgi:glycosyltransferase 2 family protein
MNDVSWISSRMRRIVRLTIQWLVPLVILALFVISGHLQSAISTLADVDPVWAAALVVVGIALPVSHAWRWCFLLRRIGESIRLAVSVRLTALASLLNYAAPGFLGAPAKAIFARNETGLPVSRSLPTLVAEQTLDALLLLVAAAVSIVIAGPVLVSALLDLYSFDRSLVAVMVVIGFIVLAMLAWFAARRVLPAFATSTESSLRMLLQGRRDLVPISILTLTRWLLDMLAVAIASVAVGLRLNIVEILLIANLSLLVGLMAPVPGGLGVREATMAALAGILGISVPAILALSVLHRAGLGIGLPIVLGAARLQEWAGR